MFCPKCKEKNIFNETRCADGLGRYCDECGYSDFSKCGNCNNICNRYENKVNENFKIAHAIIGIFRNLGCKFEDTILYNMCRLR